MGIYHDDNQGMDVFLREEPVGPDVAPEPVPVETRSASIFTFLNVGLLVVILAGAAGAAWYVYQPQIRLSAPIEDSQPFAASAKYLGEYDEIAQMVGPSPMITDAGDTLLDWSLDGSGMALVHLRIEGERGRTEAWVEWERARETWMVKSAGYLLPSGERRGVPIGDTAFLTKRDLAAWRAANPDTRLGLGQRELIQGRELKAIALFNEALSENPEDTEALLWRGRAFEKLGNVHKALADYNRILSFDPQNQSALAQLDKLKASPPPGTPVAEPPTREEVVPKPLPPSVLIPE